MQKANFYSNGHADLADHTDDFNENENGFREAPEHPLECKFRKAPDLCS